MAKTYLPGFDKRLKDTCEFVTKYGSTIIAVTATLAPTDLAAMEALITAIQAGCTLVERIHKLQDPDFGDTVSG